jgi:hypothetical protein
MTFIDLLATRSHRGDHRSGASGDRLLTATSASPGSCRARGGSNRIRCRRRASAGSSRGRRSPGRILHRRRTGYADLGEAQGRPERLGDPPGAAGVNGVAAAVVSGDAPDQKVPLSRSSMCTARCQVGNRLLIHGACLPRVIFDSGVWNQLAGLYPEPCGVVHRRHGYGIGNSALHRAEG